QPQPCQVGVRGPDEGLTLFIDDAARLARLYIDVDEAKSLMAAVDFFIREVLAIFVPTQSGKTEVEAFDIRFDLFLVGHVEEIHFIPSEFVARQRVRPRVQLGPTATGG